MQATSTTSKAWASAHDQHMVFLLIVGFAGAYTPISTTLMPLLVHTWMRQLGTSESAVGYLASIAALGSTLGLFASGWILVRVSLPRTALVGLTMSVACDFGSIFAWNVSGMALLRFIGGLGAGLAMGVFIGWYARHRQADRCFGIFFMYQFALGGAVIAIMPWLEAALGLSAIYMTLIVWGSGALLAAPLLGIETPKVGPAAGDAPAEDIINAAVPFRVTRLTAAVLVASGLYNLFAVGVWTYSELYGLSLGYSKDKMDLALAVASMSGTVGTLSTIALGDRFGRFRPIFWSLVVFILAIGAIVFNHPPFYLLFAQMVMVCLTWSFGWPYIQGVQAELDSTGRLAIYCMVAAAVGSVAGPASFAFLVSGTNFQPAFVLALVTSISCLLILLAPMVSSDKMRKARLGVTT